MHSQRFSSFTKKISQLADGKAPRTHTPIHGGNNCYLPHGFKQLFKYDLSEIEGLDDLSNPNDAIAKTQAKCAEMFQVEHSYFSVNGASACILASCLALGQGGKVLVPSNAHKSVISGLILSGAEPVFYQPEWDSQWGLYRGVNVERIADLLESTDKLKGCLVTSPTYEGIQTQLGSLVEICHEREVPVIVDESHGAHLSLTGAGNGAVNACADLIIHSPHKTLGSLTQTGLLHVQSQLIDHKKVEACLNILQTTSPSYLLLASLIETLESLFVSLKPLIQQALMANNLRYELSKIAGIQFLDNNDLTRCVLSLKDWSGHKLSEWLYDNYKIESELESNKWMMLLVGLGMKWHQTRYLKKAIEKASKQSKKNTENLEPETEPALMTCSSNPREAFFKNVDAKIEFKCPPGVASDFPGLAKLLVHKAPAKPKLNKVEAKPSSQNPFFEEDFDDEPDKWDSDDEPLDEELANYA